MGERELQAFPAHLAARADHLGTHDLLLTRAFGGYREEKVRVGGQAGASRPPVRGGPGRSHLDFLTRI
jgi:hypothetical protein